MYDGSVYWSERKIFSTQKKDINEIQLDLNEISNHIKKGILTKQEQNVIIKNYEMKQNIQLIFDDCECMLILKK